MRWLILLTFSLTGCQTLLWPTPRAVEDGVFEPQDDLALAAKCLDRGDEVGAMPYLAALVREHPEQVMFRAQLAELLYRLDRDDQARLHFERFVAAAQDLTGAPQKHLVHCHTRLMELACRGEQPADELFHQGAGLLALARQGLGEGADLDEAVLCQATKALERARDARPHDPRVRLYLGDAYARMGNRRAAEQEWKAAASEAMPGALTPAESRRLSLHNP